MWKYISLSDTKINNPHSKIGKLSYQIFHARVLSVTNKSTLDQLHTHINDDVMPKQTSIMLFYLYWQLRVLSYICNENLAGLALFKVIKS